MKAFILLFTAIVFFIFIGAMVAFKKHEELHHLDTMAGDEGDD